MAGAGRETRQPTTAVSVSIQPRWTEATHRSEGVSILRGDGRKPALGRVGTIRWQYTRPTPPEQSAGSSAARTKSTGSMPSFRHGGGEPDPWAMPPNGIVCRCRGAAIGPARRRLPALGDRSVGVGQAGRVDRPRTHGGGDGRRGPCQPAHVAARAGEGRSGQLP